MRFCRFLLNLNKPKIKKMVLVSSLITPVIFSFLTTYAQTNNKERTSLKKESVKKNTKKEEENKNLAAEQLKLIEMNSLETKEKEAKFEMNSTVSDSAQTIEIKPAEAADAKPPQSNQITTMGMAKTLPKNVLRVRFPTAFSFGGSGFDSGGKRMNTGFYYERLLTATVIEYGVTDRLSFGLGVPFYLINSLTLNGATFKKSKMFKEKYEEMVDVFVADIIKDGKGQIFCGTTAEECKDKILNTNFITTIEKPVILPTGEKISIPSTEPIRDFISDFLVNAATPSPGETGVGDLQGGFVYGILSEKDPNYTLPIYLSAGLALRAPTGKYNVPLAMRSIGGDGTVSGGGGTFNVILKTNLDFKMSEGSYLSWSHSFDKSLTKAKLRRSSILNPAKFNTADPDLVDTETGKTGDTVDNELTMERRGFHTFGVVQLSVAPGEFVPAMKSLALFTQFKYNRAAKLYLNGVNVVSSTDQLNLNKPNEHMGGVQNYNSINTGLVVSGIPYKIPVELQTEYEFAVAGTNRPVSPSNLQVSLHFFLRF